MPTTEPLDFGDDEGQLKPIARFHEPPAEPGAEPTSPSSKAALKAAASRAAEAPSPRASAPAPAMTAGNAGGGQVRRTTLGAPTLRLHTQASKEAASATAAAAANGSHSESTFTDQDLEKQWQAYIESHGSEQILVNTMRTSRPERISEKEFEIVVESEIQVELMAEAMPGVLDYLHKALNNDGFVIRVRANNGKSSPVTWNEREVLADITARHPELQEFISTLGLTLS